MIPPRAYLDHLARHTYPAMRRGLLLRPDAARDTVARLRRLGLTRQAIPSAGPYRAGPASLCAEFGPRQSRIIRPETTSRLWVPGAPQ